MASLICSEEISSTLCNYNYVASCTPSPSTRFQHLLETELVYAIPLYETFQVDGFTVGWRRKIVEWLFQVADAYGLQRETVAVAMSYLDRYLGGNSVGKRVFQLASIGCLFLASKMFEGRGVRMEELVGLSRGAFKSGDVRNMEKVLLRSLKWHLHPPTAGTFVRVFGRLLEEPIAAAPNTTLAGVLEMAEFFTELSVCEYFFLQFQSSVVGISSVLSSLERLGVPEAIMTDFFERCGQEFNFDCGSEEVISCRAALGKMYIASNVGTEGETPSATSPPNSANETTVEVIKGALPGEKARRDTESPVCVEGLDPSLAASLDGLADGQDSEDECDEEVACINHCDGRVPRRGGEYAAANEPHTVSVNGGRVSSSSGFVVRNTQAALRSHSAEPSNQRESARGRRSSFDSVSSFRLIGGVRMGSVDENLTQEELSYSGSRKRGWEDELRGGSNPGEPVEEDAAEDAVPPRQKRSNSTGGIGSLNELT